MSGAEITGLTGLITFFFQYGPFGAVLAGLYLLYSKRLRWGYEYDDQTKSLKDEIAKAEARCADTLSLEREERKAEKNELLQRIAATITDYEGRMKGRDAEYQEERDRDRQQLEKWQSLSLELLMVTKQAAQNSETAATLAKTAVSGSTAQGV